MYVTLSYNAQWKCFKLIHLPCGGLKWNQHFIEYDFQLSFDVRDICGY